MDKTREVRRGASRFSRQINKQSGQKLFSGLDSAGGDFVSLEKSKKEKVRRMSAVNGRGAPSNDDCEMGCCDFSDRENECPSQSQSAINNGSGKRFKIPKKFFDDYNVVDHASVPRKLRSAVKKRNRESVSPPLPDSKKLNHTNGVESPQKDDVNKKKLNLKQGDLDWSQRLTVSGPITKDEEEVVETLYALAGMFPDNDPTDKNKPDGESLKAKISAPSETGERLASSVGDSTVTKEMKSGWPLPAAAEPAPLSSLTKSPDKTDSLSGPSFEELAAIKKPNIELDSTPQVNMNTAVFTSEHSDGKPPCISSNLNVLPQLSLETGVKHRKQQATTPLERKLDIAFGVTAVEGQSELQQPVVKEPVRSGLALWPVLPSTPNGAGTHGSSQSSAAKIPAWLDAAICASKASSLESSSRIGKVSKVTVDRKSMKRCAEHVYISRLIRVLQMEEGKESLPLESFELKPHEGLKQGIPMLVNECNGVRNGINGSTPCSSVGNSAPDRNPYESRSGRILQHIKPHEGRPEVTPLAAMHTSQKKSFDFLSLSTGGGTTEFNNTNSNKTVNASESLPQFQVPYLHSIPQHHQSLAPFSVPQTRCTSSAYSDQHSAAAAVQQVQLQLPQYLSSPFGGPPYTSHSGMVKQHQQQQQQQRFWAAQLAAQYRPAGTSTALTQFPGWQNGKLESTALVSCPPSILPPPPPSSVGVVGSKYTVAPQQHPQPLMAISSALAAKLKRQDHHLPFVYDESGGLRAGSALQMQLLCNERL